MLAATSEWNFRCSAGQWPSSVLHSCSGAMKLSWCRQVVSHRTSWTHCMVVGQEFVMLRRGNRAVEGSCSWTVHALYASFETAKLSRRNMDKPRVCEISSWLISRTKTKERENKSSATRVPLKLSSNSTMLHDVQFRHTYALPATLLILLVMNTFVIIRVG